MEGARAGDARGAPQQDLHYRRPQASPLVRARSLSRHERSPPQPGMPPRRGRRESAADAPGFGYIPLTAAGPPVYLSQKKGTDMKQRLGIVLSVIVLMVL